MDSQSKHIDVNNQRSRTSTTGSRVLLENCKDRITPDVRGSECLYTRFRTRLKLADFSFDFECKTAA